LLGLVVHFADKVAVECLSSAVNAKSANSR
jgi:hypothetical protein